MDVRERLKIDLSALGDITIQSMFGGYGIYWREVTFSILADRTGMVLWPDMWAAAQMSNQPTTNVRTDTR